MLSDPNSDVAVGNYGVYALVLACGQEHETANGTSVWKCTQAEILGRRAGAGVLSLMRNMRNHMTVRLMRSWKLRSPLAPRCGVRYDGL